ncbi:hypothetical protein [Acidocella sp.]|uniref:hypothetical protein n=1 Tax=Acidocella sp. TaxID=50710 RepID=UPI00262CA311|nr:hypothetical protein [Acidocella sp.]
MNKLTRRGLCAGAAALPALARAAPKLGSALVAAILRQMAALGDGPVLLNSYLVRTGPRADDFDLTQANAAYVYDNALAGLLLLAAGQEAQARRIGAALALAQAHDRKFHDGRLRNAYAAGPVATPAKLPGFWNVQARQWDEDPYQTGTATGPVAWAMLLWAALGMTGPANAAGNFLNAALRAPLGYYGGLYGFDTAQLRLGWRSTEQNLDLAVAFARLGRAGDAAHARAFVAAAYDKKRGIFMAGLTPEGAPNAMLAADAGIWPYLAGLGDAASASRAIAHLRHGFGIGFSTASDGIWLEGTAFAALALARMRDPMAKDFLRTIAANLSPQGYVYATVAPELSTGLTVGPSLRPGLPERPFNYYRRPSLSATGWAALAALEHDPI